MKVESIALGPNKNQLENNSKILSPELLASVGARYSRSDLGLDEIYSMVDEGDTEKSIDNIFKFVAYGHASIADLAPVSMFLDGISFFAAYNIFAQCPVGGGQESSTRYLDFSKQGLDILIDQKYLPRPKKEYEFLFEDYKRCCQYWENYLEENPEVLDLSNLKGERKKSARRNYIFDRSRTFLPVSCKTNMMLVQSARQWARLAQYLTSSDHLEFVDIGNLIIDQLKIASPRMAKHTEKTEAFSQTSQEGVFEEQKELGFLNLDASDSGGYCEVYGKPNANLLEVRKTRYCPFNESVNMIPVKFGWNKIPFAEIRDFSRHRTGSKSLDLKPRGYYFAQDQLLKPDSKLGAIHVRAIDHSVKLQEQYNREEKSWVYNALLGTEFSYSHTTTLNQFLYQCEIRTSKGAHFRYRELMNDVLNIFLDKNPDFKGKLFDNQV